MTWSDALPSGPGPLCSISAPSGWEGPPGVPSGTHEPGHSPARKRPPRLGSTASLPLLCLGPEMPCPFFPSWAQKHGDWRFQKTRQTWLLLHMYDSNQVCAGGGFPASPAPCWRWVSQPHLHPAGGVSQLHLHSSSFSAPGPCRQWCLLSFCSGSPVTRTGGSDSSR